MSGQSLSDVLATDVARYRARAERAEAALRDLRERLEALVGEWRQPGVGRYEAGTTAVALCADDLLAALRDITEGSEG